MKNHSLSILISINLVFMFGAALLGPLYAVYVQEQIGKDILTIGWAFAVYMMTIGTLTYVAGKWTDRVKEKEYFVAAGYLIRAIGFLLYTVIGSVPELLLVQFFWVLEWQLQIPRLSRFILFIWTGEKSQWNGGSGIWPPALLLVARQ